MSTTTLDAYKAKYEALKRAKRYLAHFKASGYQGQTYRPYNVGEVAPAINLQYEHCGKNYWYMAEDAPELIPYVKAVMIRELHATIEKAVADMEADLSKLREAARSEYADMFGEVIS